jgi:ParB family chromosome partitioning protein
MKITLGSSNEQVIKLSVDDLIPDMNQPRKAFEAEGLKELAQSLTETGQISPIIVKPRSDKKYIIIVGERRWRAAKDAGLRHIDCIVRKDVGDQKIVEIQLAENYQRSDIGPLDQGRALYNYLQKYPMSQSELSKRTGIPQRTISARLALYSLPVSMHAKVEAGEIGPYQAIEISKLPSEKQEYIAMEITAHRLCGRKLEEALKQLKKGPELPLVAFTQTAEPKRRFTKTYNVKVSSAVERTKVESVYLYDPRTAEEFGYVVSYVCDCGMKAAVFVMIRCKNCNKGLGCYAMSPSLVRI